MSYVGRRELPDYEDSAASVWVDSSFPSISSSSISSSSTALSKECSLSIRFVTKADLTKLGLDHLMGTPMLRAYMHGFFVDNRLYEKAKILTDPFAYETYRAQRVQKKIDEERKSRISLVRKLPKV